MVLDQLSYRPEAGGIKLKRGIHNAHGYQFLVEFTLLSTMPNYQGIQSTHSISSSEQSFVSAGSHTFNDTRTQYLTEKRGDNSLQNLSPTLSRPLDVLVNLAQTEPAESAGSTGSRGFKSSHTKAIGYGRSHTSSSD